MMGVMMLNELGMYVNNNLENIQQHYPYAEIPLFVVMPNHIHLIIAVNQHRNCRDAMHDVSTITQKNEKMQSIANKCGQLSHIISNFKSAVTRYANQNNIPFAWQTRFYDRIIRDQNEYNRIANYIEKNPINWT